MAKKIDRIGEVNTNKKGCVMKIVEYINCLNIFVEFQDKYKTIVHTSYDSFLKGSVKNPYETSVYNAGITGGKYPTINNGEIIKEYNTWRLMIKRVFDIDFKKEYPTYQDVTCCEEWLLYENFYEWVHSQENFNKWLMLDKSSLDKDILIKGNKVYSPETCCLVPHEVNKLFTKSDIARGEYPIGVSLMSNCDRYQASCNNYFGNKIYLGLYLTPADAFNAYKEYKEGLIKQVAQQEFNKGNITEKCYKAMMNYQVEITD